MIVMGIDPGSCTHGVVVYDSTERRVLHATAAASDEQVADAAREHRPQIAAIEWIEASGRPFGHDLLATIDACYRLEALVSAHVGVRHIRRSEVLRALGVRRGGRRRAGEPVSTDSKVRSALIALHGGPAAIREGGALHGVTSHAWAALAVSWAHGRAPADGARRASTTSRATLCATRKRK